MKPIKKLKLQAKVMGHLQVRHQSPRRAKPHLPTQIKKIPLRIPSLQNRLKPARTRNNHVIPSCSRVMSTIRKYLIAGLLVWIPLAATVFIVKLVIDLMDMTILLLPENLHPQNLWGFDIPGIGLVLALAVLVLTGALAANLIGRSMVDIWENILGRIPLVRNIYNAFKQIATTVLASGNKSFRKVVLVEFPKNGVWSVGFLTNDEIHIESTSINNDMVSVFISTTPNPTSGFLILISKDKIIELNISAEEAFKLIMSIGVVIPDHTIKELQDKNVAQSPHDS
jgi:uncharacterized membrane protein